MEMLMRLVTRVGDKLGSLGALVSAMGCAMCFPAIASLGAAVGLGFLSQWEGLFINTICRCLHGSLWCSMDLAG